MIIKDAAGKNDSQIEKELKAVLNGKIAKFKIPERIIVTKAIPK